MPCMCGAYDCYACHPESFRVVGRQRVYVGDMDEDQEAVAVAEAEDAQIDAAMVQRDAAEWNAAHGPA